MAEAGDGVDDPVGVVLGGVPEVLLELCYREGVGADGTPDAVDDHANNVGWPGH